MPRGEVRRAWADEVGRFLLAAHRVLAPGGPLVLLMADSAVGDIVLRAGEVVAHVARDVGFDPVANSDDLRALKALVD